MANSTLKESDTSSSEDVVLPQTIQALENIEKQQHETSSHITQGRKRAIATFLILGNSILASNPL